MLEFSNLKELPKKLSQLQVAIQNPKRTKKAYNYRYADMDEVLDCIKKPCSEHGFSVIQMPFNDADLVGVETILLHESGEYIKGKFGSKMNKFDPQSVGSQISYYRRYSLLAMFNLGQEDDDGQAVSGKVAQNGNMGIKLASDNQKKFLKNLMGDAEYNKHIEFIEKKMTIEQAKEKIEQLNKK